MLESFLMMRLAAVLLLTFMCLDLGMDLWQGEIGDSDSAGPNLSAAYAGQASLNISASAPQSGSKDFTHECFCCCSQLEQQGSAIVPVVLKSGPQYFDVTTHSLEPDLFRIYHPPQQVI